MDNPLLSTYQSGNDEPVVRHQWIAKRKTSDESQQDRDSGQNEHSNDSAIVDMNLAVIEVGAGRRLTKKSDDTRIRCHCMSLEADKAVAGKKDKYVRAEGLTRTIVTEPKRRSRGLVRKDARRGLRLVDFHGLHYRQTMDNHIENYSVDGIRRMAVHFKGQGMGCCGPA